MCESVSLLCTVYKCARDRSIHRSSVLNVRKERKTTSETNNFFSASSVVPTKKKEKTSIIPMLISHNDLFIIIITIYSTTLFIVVQCHQHVTSHARCFSMAGRMCVYKKIVFVFIYIHGLELLLLLPFMSQLQKCWRMSHLYIEWQRTRIIGIKYRNEVKSCCATQFCVIRI